MEAVSPTPRRIDHFCAGDFTSAIIVWTLTPRPAHPLMAVTNAVSAIVIVGDAGGCPDRNGLGQNDGRAGGGAGPPSTCSAAFW